MPRWVDRPDFAWVPETPLNSDSAPAKDFVQAVTPAPEPAGSRRPPASRRTHIEPAPRIATPKPAAAPPRVTVLPPEPPPFVVLIMPVAAETADDRADTDPAPISLPAPVMIVDATEPLVVEDAPAAELPVTEIVPVPQVALTEDAPVAPPAPLPMPELPPAETIDAPEPPADPVPSSMEAAPQVTILAPFFRPPPKPVDIRALRSTLGYERIEPPAPVSRPAVIDFAAYAAQAEPAAEQKPIAAIPGTESATVLPFSTEPPPRIVPPASHPLRSGPGYRAVPQAPAAELAKPAPAPANSNTAPDLLRPRLGIGLAQGFGLYLLFLGRDHGIWPGGDPWLFAALSLAGLFAPLVLLEGLGEMPRLLLRGWAVAVALGAAGLGLYQHWRIQGPEETHTGATVILLTGLILFIGQALLRSWTAGRGLRAPYGVYHDAAWTLAGRLLVWAVLTGIAWAMIGSGNSLLNWLRPHYPLLHLGDPSVITLPLVGLASAAAIHWTAGGSRVRQFMKNALITCATFALVPVMAVAVLVLTYALAIEPVSMALSLTFALLLLLGFNASYRGAAARSMWRRDCELAAAFLILALAALAAVALSARVAQYGWTPGRIFAATGTALLGLYGLVYAGAGLISIGGGDWMRRIEKPNIALALVVIATAVALCTPLSDPLRLSVEAQRHRVESGRVDPAAFDFDWMRRDGGRFGNDTLMAMTRESPADVARAAAITLSVTPGSMAPTPTEVGANITVRTAGARLPDALLVHDWRHDPAMAGKTVPPCLTIAALACDAWFLDLDGDGANEILLVYGNDVRWWAAVMKQGPRGDWWPAATLTSPPCRGSLTALRAGAFVPAQGWPRWHDLLVAGIRLHPTPTDNPVPACPH